VVLFERLNAKKPTEEIATIIKTKMDIAPDNATLTEMFLFDTSLATRSL
jgi:hypothetical protein